MARRSWAPRLNNSWRKMGNGHKFPIDSERVVVNSEYLPALFWPMHSTGCLLVEKAVLPGPLESQPEAAVARVNRCTISYQSTFSDRGGRGRCHVGKSSYSG